MQEKAKPIDVAWMQKQFDDLHRDHTIIFGRLNDLEQLIRLILASTTPNQNVIPELEAAVKTVSVSAIAIDTKVPDKKE